MRSSSSTSRATSDNRATTVELASRAAGELRIPYTVGGGFRDVAGCRTMIAAGPTRCRFNSAAVRDLSLITAAAAAFCGSQAVICAIDAKRVPGGGDRWEVYLAGGRQATGIDAVAWAEEAARRGAGRFCSRAWTATARGTVLTSPSPVRWRAPCRSR